MAFRLLDDSTQSSQFIVLLVFTPLGIIVTGLRFIIAPGSGRKIGLEDWSAVVATIFSTLANLGALMGEPIGALPASMTTTSTDKVRRDSNQHSQWAPD